MNKLVLVTGSKGFIGSHLMKALGDRGIHYDIHKSAAFDVNKPDTLKAVILANKPKVIVHLAAKSSRQDVDKDPELALRTNIIGTFNVLRLAHKYGIRVVLASSAATVEPELSLYGTTKDCMERLAKMFPDNVTVARFYNVYGPGSKSVINKFVKRMKQNKPIKLNGNTYRDYVHVDDVVANLLSLIDAAMPERFVMIGTGRSVSLKKVVSIIRKYLSTDSKIVEGPAIKEIQASECDFRYGKYKVTLEQGIRRLI